MSTHKHFDLICVAVLILMLLTTVLFINGERLGIQVIVDEDAEANSDSSYFTANDRKEDWDTAGATRITLKGGTASISGGGAYVYDGDVIISGAGTYVVSGTLDDGSIVVDANSKAKVWLLFDGVTVNCSDNACLRVEQADKVFLTLAADSENSLVSGAVYSQTAQDGGVDGAVFARDDLTINGSGALTVTAGYKHGISANDDLVITGGSITVSAPADALRANDSLRICEASVTADAGDDGVVVNHADGYLYVESGTLHITSAGDAIHSEGDFWFAGGSLTISAADDGIHADTGIVITGGSIDITNCYEGIEAVTIDISGGDILVHTSDDGLNANGNSFGFGGFGPGAQTRSETDAEETWIHISGGSVTVLNDTGNDADGLDSNGDIVISGGTVLVSMVNSGSNNALDCGSESGGTMTVSGGTVVACGSYGMAEAFDASSGQCSILYNIQAGAEAGTTVSLEDSAGNVLLSYEVPNSFSSVALSTPEMQLGESYLVVIGDKVEEITLTEVSASYGDAASSGFGGNMNWGGMQRREDFQGFESEDGAMPQRPEGDQGVRPDFANGAERPDDDGEMPAFDGAMPSPPEGMEEGAEPPAMPEDGSMQPMGGRPGGRQEQESQSAQQTVQEETAEETASAVTGETWLLVALSAAALIAGLILAIKYKQE